MFQENMQFFLEKLTPYCDSVDECRENQIREVLAKLHTLLINFYTPGDLRDWSISMRSLIPEFNSSCDNKELQDLFYLEIERIITNNIKRSNLQTELIYQNRQAEDVRQEGLNIVQEMERQDGENRQFANQLNVIRSRLLEIKHRGDNDFEVRSLIQEGDEISRKLREGVDLVKQLGNQVSYKASLYQELLNKQREIIDELEGQFR